MKNDTYTWNVGGEEQFAQSWRADAPKATIALVHGMGEHSGRYAHHFAPFFTERGFDILAFDHLGHGQTTGKRGHCPGGYDAVLDSVDHLYHQARSLFGADRPLFVYGHSMGGNVVLNHALRRAPEIAGLVASAPMLRLAFEPPKWKMALGKKMIRIMPSFTENTGLDSVAISRDPAEVEAYENDPLVHSKISAAFSIPFFEAGEWAIEHAGDSTIDTLVLHGTGDQLTSAEGTKAFARNGNEHVSIQLFDGLYHELHHEPEHEEVLTIVADWMDERIA